jgi:CRP-like cAMP-binding protein
MKEERLRMLQNMPIFGGIRQDILELLLEDAAEISLAEGGFLFLENDPSDAMYVLEKGQVAILKRWNKIYYRLSYLNAGDCIGEMSLIDLGRRSASVLAMTECKAIELKHALIFRLYQEDLEQFALIQMNISRELSRRLRVADETLFRELIKTNQIPQH